MYGTRIGVSENIVSVTLTSDPTSFYLVLAKIRHCDDWNFTSQRIITITIPMCLVTFASRSFVRSNSSRQTTTNFAATRHVRSKFFYRSLMTRTDRNVAIFRDFLNSRTITRTLTFVTSTSAGVLNDDQLISDHFENGLNQLCNTGH